MSTFMRWPLLGAALVLALGCASPEEQTNAGPPADESEMHADHQGATGTPEPDAAGVSAVCELMPTEGNSVTGRVLFTAVEGGVKVTAHVMGLTPGPHGFHVHETGDCSAPDATSAGGHFNPAQMEHGGPDAAMRHAGDLGNLVADSTGMAHYERVDTHLALEGEHSIVGRAVIVHAQVDDLTSQPTGAAGARVACGVIQRETD